MRAKLKLLRLYEFKGKRTQIPILNIRKFGNNKKLIILVSNFLEAEGQKS